MLWVARTGTTRSQRAHWGDACRRSAARGQPRHSRQLKMADLRTAVESLGHTDVETYLQSGNVVFTPARGAWPRTSGRRSRGARRDRRHRRPRADPAPAPSWRKVVAANPYRPRGPDEGRRRRSSTGRRRQAGRGAATSPTSRRRASRSRAPRSTSTSRAGRPAPSCSTPSASEGLRHDGHLAATGAPCWRCADDVRLSDVSTSGPDGWGRRPRPIWAGPRPQLSGRRFGQRCRIARSQANGHAQRATAGSTPW